jgi:hypothetical protein
MAARVSYYRATIGQGISGKEDQGISIGIKQDLMGV